MAKIAGVDVLLYVNNGTEALPVFTVVGGQSGATLTRSTKIIETTSKEANGWAENVAGVNSWGIECEGFIVADDSAILKLETIWQTRGTAKAEIQFPDGRKYSGDCIISDFPMEFPQDDAASYKLSLTGQGALIVTPVA